MGCVGGSNGVMQLCLWCNVSLKSRFQQMLRSRLVCKSQALWLHGRTSDSDDDDVEDFETVKPGEVQPLSRVVNPTRAQSGNRSRTKTTKWRGFEDKRT